MKIYLQFLGLMISNLIVASSGRFEEPVQVGGVMRCSYRLLPVKEDVKLRYKEYDTSIEDVEQVEFDNKSKNNKKYFILTIHYGGCRTGYQLVFQETGSHWGFMGNVQISVLDALENSRF